MLEETKETGGTSKKKLLYPTIPMVTFLTSKIQVFEKITVAKNNYFLKKGAPPKHQTPK